MSFVMPPKEWPAPGHRHINKQITYRKRRVPDCISGQARQGNAVPAMVTALLLLLLSSITTATGANETLARQNYILNCQGCHLADGSGSPGNVPKLNDFMGYFLHVDGGREFIVQVPGVAGSPISDQELADVMNWVLRNFSNNELPDPFIPYNAEEVGQLRQEPQLNLHQRREELIAKIRDKLGGTEY